MRVTSFVLGLAAVIFCSCATQHYTKCSGDVGQFILQRAISYGGTPTTTNSLPQVMSHWRYSEDLYGVQIYMPRSDYSAVDSLLNQAFAGKPQFGPHVSQDGNTVLHEFRLTAKGGGVQLSCHPSYALVIVMRPMSQEEWNSVVMPDAFKTIIKPQ